MSAVLSQIANQMPVKQYLRPLRPRQGHHQHVTVIGAGIVGLASAAALVRSGRSVTIVDANAAVGASTSAGNGCQLSYGYVAPLAQPSLLPELPELLFTKAAPLRIVPQWDVAQWRWMLRFLQACSPSRATASSLALLELGRQSREETDLWLQDSDLDALSYSEAGKLVVLPSAAAFAKARQQLEMQAPYGPPQRPIDEAECLRVEPALHAFKGRIAGAIHTPSECAIDSLALCRELELQLREHGVRFELGNKVQDVRTANGRVTHVVTDTGTAEVDGLVLATGPGSAAMARKLGFYLPVYPLKGYSITARIKDPDGVPHVSVTDASKKVVYARIGDRLRVAGVAEVRGYDTSISAPRITELVSHTRAAFGSAVELDDVSPWAGLRPATPTSVPVIGPSPVRNVFLNVGHGALGLTLAFGSARRLAGLLDAA